jgi:hypothetical protein
MAAFVAMNSGLGFGGWLGIATWLIPLAFGAAGVMVSPLPLSTRLLVAPGFAAILLLPLTVVGVTVACYGFGSCP